VILGLSAAWSPDPRHRYLLTPTAATDTFGVEMDLLCTGSAIHWLAALLTIESEQALMSLAAEIAVEDAPPFLGYLAPGEQGALWDPALTGTVSGLHLGHTPGHVARGLLNGILLESRRCIDALHDAGLSSCEVWVAGGSARDRGFRQDLADCTGCTVIAPDGHTDQSALGAAWLTAQAVSEIVPRRDPAVGESVTEPRAERRPAWERVWERHERLRGQVTS
jgi:xylulokinase